MFKNGFTEERYDEIFGEMSFAFYMDEARDFQTWDELLVTIVEQYPEFEMELYSRGYTYREILQMFSDYLS